MANVLFKRGTKAEIDAEPISDGKILFTTDQIYNKIYTDNGTKRIQIGGTMDVDTTLSTTSSNPIANSTATAEFNKINTGLSEKSNSKTVTLAVGKTLSIPSVHGFICYGTTLNLGYFAFFVAPSSLTPVYLTTLTNQCGLSLSENTYVITNTSGNLQTMHCIY